MLRQNKSLLLATGYLVFISMLFFIPGSAFPKNDWITKIHFDKWVHIGLFTLLTYLFCRAFNPISREGMLMLFAAATCYGILVEFIQDQFVANRSLDILDWVADIFGAIMGIWMWCYLKNRPL
jgi:VanZ family protein